MTPARHLALQVLQDVENQGTTLDNILASRTFEIEALSKPDRALLNHLVFGVLRWKLRLDWQIDQLSTKPKKKLDATIRNILRLGLYQILFLDRIPNSAAVNTSVEMARKAGRSWATGFVNGLLRKATKLSTNKAIFPLAPDPMAALSITQSFPLWMLKRWFQRFGPEETEKICLAMNTIPAVTLRTNTLQTTREKLMDLLTDKVTALSPTTHSPEGIRLFSPKQMITNLDSYRNGLFQIQDEAAQLVSHLVNPQPGQLVWDACAGLGTKTFHLAMLMKNQGRIIATDRNASKLKQLQTEAVRLSISIVENRTVDLLLKKTIPDWPAFDRILMDAPCSGIGVLQKNPDGKWRILPEDLNRYAERQLNLLDYSAAYLKPAGILVYAVCSIEVEENELVVKEFLTRHREFSIHAPVMTRVSEQAGLTTPHGYIYTLPHRHQMDGFFAVALKKNI